MGTQFLTTTLSHILESATKEKMPGLCTTLEQSKRETRAELERLGYLESELGSEQVHSWRKIKVIMHLSCTYTVKPFYYLSNTKTSRRKCDKQSYTVFYEVQLKNM